MSLLFCLRSLCLRLYLILIAITTLLASLPMAVHATSPECTDTLTIFARGSGSAVNESADYLAFRDTLSAELAYRLPALSNRFYDLGSASQGGAQFLDISIENPSIITGIVFDGEASDYNHSVQTGVYELTNLIHSTLTACPQTKFILAGYSQGAQVISTTLLNSPLSPDQLIYAATFGDPKLYLPEGHKSSVFSTPSACKGLDLSPYRVNVPDCEVENGILEGLNPYLAHHYIGKIGTWCNEADPICGSYFDFSHTFDNNSYEGGESNFFTNLLHAHLAYHSDQSYAEASSLIADRLVDEFPEKSTHHSTTNASHDIAFLIDSTGSMSSLIDSYKSEALKLAQNIINQGGRIALYEYRDLIEGFQPKKHCDFSCTLDTFAAELQSITTENGDDELESALSASLIALDQLDWHFGSQKSLVILTDTGYLDPDRDDTTKSQVIKRSLEIDPVNFYVITPNPSQYTELTEATGGKAFNSFDEMAYSTTYITDRPTAHLSSMHYSGLTNTPITFDATNSSAVSPATIDHYEWDLDFDGIFEQTSFTPTISQTYPTPISGYLQVKVIDSLGRESTMSATLSVREPDYSNPTISDLSIIETGQDVRFNFQKSADAYLTLILINDQILGFIENDSFSMNKKSAMETDVKFIPVSRLGRRGNALQTAISASPSNPTSITNEQDINHNSVPNISDIGKYGVNPAITPKIPRAPNTGQH